MAPARFIGALFSRCGINWNFPWTSREPENPAHRLGRLGERIAAQHLRRHGYKVLYRNYRAKRGGEVDLVCRDKAAKTLVFVEVKTRSRVDFGDPADAVNREKQALIIRGAVSWLRLLRDDDHKVIYRFDVVEVVMDGPVPKVNVIKNAFQMPENLRA